MKHKIILSLLCLCTTGAYAQKNDFLVEGTLNKALPDGQYIYGFYFKGADLVLDSARVNNGKYVLKGMTEQQSMLTIGSRQYGQDLKLFVGPGARLKVVHQKSLANAEVSGSPANLEYNKIRTALKPYIKGMDSLDRLADVAAKAKDLAAQKKINNEADAIFFKMNAVVYPAYILKNPGSPISLAMLDEYARFEADEKKQERLFTVLSAQIKNSADGKKWAKKISIAKSTGVGKKAPDFEQNDTLGSPVKLSSLRGKYVLVDFWASWCGPCRAENPNVVKAYKKLKSQNFEVLSVSIDTDKKEWLAAIEKDGMPWLHVSDLKGEKNGAAILYGVESIPQNWLLDPNGVVIGKNLRGEDLDMQIESLMKKGGPNKSK